MKDLIEAERSSNLRFAKEFDVLKTVIRRGYDSVVTRCRTERSLGLAEPKFCDNDIPLDWPTGDREHIVWRALMFADVPSEMFEGWLKEGSRHRDSFCLNTIRKRAMRYRSEEQRRLRAGVLLRARGCEVYQGDVTIIRKLRKGSAAAVITDPPYEEISLPLWRHLVDFGAAVLADHGWLLAMSGQRHLPQVFAMMQERGLNYCWSMAVHMPGAQSATAWLGPKNSLNVEWKPVLVFCKGVAQKWPDEFRDYIVSPGNDKQYHEWGQSEEVMEKMVDKFVDPGALVVDPFMGGGTTGVAAARLGRAFEGFDVEQRHVDTAKQRIARELAAKKQQRMAV